MIPSQYSRGNIQAFTLSNQCYRLVKSTMMIIEGSVVMRYLAEIHWRPWSHVFERLVVPSFVIRDYSKTTLVVGRS